jgi:hypothetical protein
MGLQAKVMGHRFAEEAEVTMGPTTLYNGRKAIVRKQLPGISVPNYLVVLKDSREQLWAIETDFLEARGQ